MSEAKGSLADRVRDLPVPLGHLAVWALGQQGYLLKGGDHVVVIDPYLSNYVEEIAPEPAGAFARMVHIPVEPGELKSVCTILCTHHHADHCDPRTLLPMAQAAPSARLITSYKAKEVMVSEGISSERVEVPTLDKWQSFGRDFRIKAIPSAHYGHEPDAEGNPAYLGFIINLNGVTLYHPGDTIIYEGLISRLREQPIDLACLPINGRDWFREGQNLIGNMDYREASELAAAAKIGVLLPGHNDMFASNRINPAYLLDYLQANHPQQRVHFVQAGELYYYVA